MRLWNRGRLGYFRRRGRRRGRGSRRFPLWAEPQRDERDRTNLAVFRQILIVLEALEGVHGGGTPLTVRCAGEIAFVGQRLLNFPVPIGCWLLLRGPAVGGH